jgi:hypothetical protein
MKNNFVVIAGGFKIVVKVVVPGGQLDFEGQNYLPEQKLKQSIQLHLTSEPPISCKCC